jgi:predicted PurR-regulated permease PerM
MIVLDLPRLTRGAKSLESTRLRFVYKELASGVREFGLVVGRAFEAQMVIALLNTVLTGAGIYLLGIGEKVAFLSVIVFFCSFIPVAGVFISSVPICLLTLQESGFTYMLLAVGLITVTHMIEAYILNPKIYGHHLRLHPVIVLIILTTAGKLFGVWGLVLGVPICSYIFGHAIRYQDATSDSARL